MWTALLLSAAVVSLALAARGHGWLWESVGEVTARLFPRRPVPVRRLPRRLLACATATATVGVSGRMMLPGRIELRVHPYDLTPFFGALEWLRADIQSGVDEYAAARGWDKPIGLVVAVVSDETRPVGRPTAHAVFPSVRNRAYADGAKVRLKTVPAPTVPDTREALTDEPATAALGPLVEVRVDDQSSVVLTVTGAGFVVGRGRDAEVRICDRAASRAHCRIHGSDGGGLTITDLGSTNGTRLDGSPVRTAARLPKAGTLGIGSSSLRFRILDR